VTAAAAPRRRFVLLVWDAELGAAVRPVAILAVGVDENGLQHAVVWLPGVFDDAEGWRERLADANPGTIATALVRWLDEDTGLRMSEIDPGPGDVDLRTSAEFAVDELLAVVVPMFTESA
jgi:hypothetical protein